ncbi:hypothetical protein KUTeg_021422 [Tegillarca granosa]|uniref:Dimethylargininase n=1 Tax=Tegillarca granosa TaxID=220873 RepID=A0ABQ9E380_TEGGR|nr:hypothetical protein KUTeg_021422 [Tegillarca granosa]
MAFKYNYAIFCRVPNSLKGNPAEARREHENLIDVLRKCEIKPIIMEETEDYPECPFVGDCAVVIGGTALITRPAVQSRQGETKEVRRVLKQDLKLKINEILDADATVDGGDVLFTGKEIFVGVRANGTNTAGAKCVQDAFPEYYVTPIFMDPSVSGNRHLKDMVNMAGRDIMAVGNSPAAQKVFKQMKSLAQYSYRILHLESDTASDMLYVNNRLVHRTREEIGEKSYSVSLHLRPFGTLKDKSFRCV